MSDRDAARCRFGVAASRREFLGRSAGVAGAAALGSLSWARSAHAAGSDVIRVGLIGCGGRGSGAAVNALNAGRDVRLTAMADLFEDRVRGARDRIAKHSPEQALVDDDHCFWGFDGYRRVIESGVNVVLIAAASHFHPMHLKAAVEAGKHVFCEKPHGIDVPGLKVAAAAAEEAKRQGLALMSGLCWRYDLAVRETMRRVADGAIGDIVAVQENYVGGPYVLRKRQPGWSEIEYQFQNWYHFNWLSGDQTSQQLIHSLDKASWALGDRPPLRAWGLGGRQVCTGPEYGDQFDQHAVVYEYDDGVRLFAYCRAIPGCFNTTSDILLGTKGRAVLPQRCAIEGENPWRFEGAKPSMYDVAHQELFASIRDGKPIHDGGHMITSTMLGILGQIVCYTGQEITWERAMESKLDFSLPRYDWDIEPPVVPGPDGIYPTAMPGMTPFV